MNYAAIANVLGKLLIVTGSSMVFPLICSLYYKEGDLYAITFEWPDGYLELPIPEPPPGTRVSLLGRDGELPWRYRAGSLRIDLSDIPASEVPGQWAWTVRLEGYAEAHPTGVGETE